MLCRCTQYLTKHILRCIESCLVLTTCEEGSLVFLLLFYPLKSSVAENRSIVEFTLIEVVGVFAPIKKIVVAHNHSSYLYKKK